MDPAIDTLQEREPATLSFNFVSAAPDLYNDPQFAMFLIPNTPILPIQSIPNSVSCPLQAPVQLNRTKSLLFPAAKIFLCRPLLHYLQCPDDTILPLMRV